MGTNLNNGYMLHIDKDFYVILIYPSLYKNIQKFKGMVIIYSCEN